MGTENGQKKGQGRALATLASDVLSDALSIFGIPANTGKAALANWLEGRATEARDLLLEQMRKARVSEVEAASQDDAIEVIYRYYLAVRDGAARRNMRLLAAVMAGLAKKDRLYAEDFNRFVDQLASLSRDQILVLGRYYAAFLLEVPATDQEKRQSDAWGALKDELVPLEFKSQAHLEAVCAQLIPTGFIFQVGVFGGNAYRLSPLIGELAAIPEFANALREETLAASD